MASCCTLEFTARLSAAIRAAELPEDLQAILLETWDESFKNALNAVLAEPSYLRALVDPWHALPEGYSPLDLVPLRAGYFNVARNDLRLRQAAADSLVEMARAARGDGIILTAASSYRSYAHQTQVHNRLIAQMGLEAARRVSARPGHSQHQTGLALDFYPIHNRFAQTPAGIWVKGNASRFGWSLSYPESYEHITGYSWESWHFRYLGRELAAFKDRYFGGIQQFALRFLHEWQRQPHGPESA